MKLWPRRYRSIRTDVLTASYRDDNHYFWEFDEFDLSALDCCRIWHAEAGLQTSQFDGIY